MIREDIRVEYDNSKAKLLTLEEKIKSQKENSTMEKGEIARLDDEKVLLERDRDRFLGQMKGLDIEIQGAKPSADLPEGHQGINQQLDALRELQQMLKEYMKEV
jgi:hypothetical protein